MRKFVKSMLLGLIPFFLFTSCSTIIPKFGKVTGDWTEVSTSEQRITCLCFDKKTPDTIYAGTEKGLYISRDKGKTWERSKDSQIGLKKVYKMQSDADNNIYVLAGPDNEAAWGNIYKLQSGGSAFELFVDSENIPAPGKTKKKGFIKLFRVNPKKPGSILVFGFNYSSILLSEDSGKRWSLISDFNGTEDVGWLDFDQENPDMVYYETGMGPTNSERDFSKVFGSKTKGTDWKLLFESKSGQGRISQFAVIPGSNSALISYTPQTTENKKPVLYKSGPQTWEKAVWEKQNVSGLDGWVENIFAVNGNVFYAQFYGTDMNTVMKTEDGGKSWNETGIPLKDSNDKVSILSVSPDSSDLYVVADYYMEKTRLLKFVEKKQ